jgi:hypothetical protein
MGDEGEDVTFNSEIRTKTESESAKSENKELYKKQQKEEKQHLQRLLYQRVVIVTMHD